MAGLRFNIDADLTRFSQLVKKIQEVRKEMEKLSKFSPNYNKLYGEFKKIPRFSSNTSRYWRPPK